MIWTGRVAKGQRLRVSGASPLHFVAFDAANRRERFDDSRTRGNQAKLFISSGNLLLSKSNRPMLRIEADRYEGRHDLEMGTCAACARKLAETLGMQPEEIPAAFNLFLTVEVDDKGALTPLPSPAGEVELAAQIDCLVGIAACPDLGTPPRAFDVAC